MTHRTIGKVTYIHERPVPDFTGLDDPALQVQPRPIPVMVIGDSPVRIEVHYGDNIPPTRRRVHWGHVALGSAVILFSAGAYITAYLILAQLWRMLAG